jgi:predicted KAP-like P-loop ATPase
MTVVADQPITKIEEDRFERGAFAKRIAGVISSLKDKSSIVVSVNAPWGEGKTSVLNMVEEELNRLGNSVVIRFNPWRFPDEDKLLSSFFKVLAEKIGAELETASEKKMGKVKKAWKYLSLLKTVGVDTDAITNLIETYHQNPDVEEVRNRVNQALQVCSQRIVIFMDDIDRLDNREIQAVFRLVKLTADFSNTAYILAYDDKKVAASLAEQFGGKKDAGRSFLEKIVQVPLPVPLADPIVLRRMVFDGISSALDLIEDELTQEEARQFVTVFDKSFRQMLTSPRTVKRFTNMLNFVLPILKGEVYLLDLILIEGVRVFYPRVYETVRAEFGTFLKDSLEYAFSLDKEKKKVRFGKILAKSVRGFTEDERDGVHFALQMLFPNIQEYGINVAMPLTSSNSDEWEKKKRICTSRYFRRYFNYGIPPNDISDREIEEFINILSRSGVEELKDKLETFCSEDRAEILIQKLRMYQEKITSSGAGILAIAISMRGDLIPESHPDDNIFGIGTLPQAAFLLRELIDREIATARDNLAKSVAKNIDRLPFAYEFSRKIRKLRKEQGSEEFVSVVSDECEQEITRILADKLAEAAEIKPLEYSHPLWKRNFYIAWRWGNLESLRQYARRRLERHPEDVSNFLGALLGVSNDPKDDYGHIPIPEPDAEFKFLSDILDPDEWMKFIHQNYPKKNNDNLPRAVRWFVQMYDRFARISKDTQHRM